MYSCSSVCLSVKPFATKISRPKHCPLLTWYLISKPLTEYPSRLKGTFYNTTLTQNKNPPLIRSSLYQILEKTREFQIDIHHFFIDFKQAYHDIIRDELIRNRVESKQIS
ncbi:hypothetical protein ACFFRR_009761 [Megaselia abdita]